MSKYAAFLACITIDSSNKTIRFVEGSTTTDVTLTEGDYYLRGDGTADDLCEAVKDAFESNADAAGNTYTVGLACSVDPASPTAVVTVTRASGAGSFSILWEHANTTFDPLLIGHVEEDTAHDGTAKAGTLSPTALWVSSDIVAFSEPEEEYDVTVEMPAPGRLRGVRTGGPYPVRRVSFDNVDALRVHDDMNLDDPAAAFMRFHERTAIGVRFEMHEATLSSATALGALSSSTRIGTAWHFDEETANDLDPERREPGLPIYSFSLRLLASTDAAAVTSAPTFAARLADGEGRNMRKYVTIEGVRHIMQDGDSDVPSALIDSARTRVQCIQTLEQGRRELDMVARKAKGGGLRLRLVDDDAHTLRSIFTMRKRRATFISANVAAAGATITVKNTSLFPAAGDFWVAGECISYTGKTATTFTGCTRGAYGTRARALRGGTNNGQAVYVSPPSWIGRVVTLKGYFLEHDGTDPTSTDMQETLGTFEIDSPPQYIGGDVWELSAVDRIDGYLKKGLYVGVEETSAPPFNLVVDNFNGTGAAHADLTNAQMLALFGTTTVGTDLSANHAQVLLKAPTPASGNDWWLLATVTGISIVVPTDPNADARVEINYEPGLNPIFQPDYDNQANALYRYQFESARPAPYLREKADSIALKVLTSRAGAAANGANDVLLGYNAETSTDTEPDLAGWRLGGNITLADIDTGAFTAVGARIEWFWLLAESTSVGDFLREFCMATDSFVCTNTAGQLSVKLMSDTKSSAITTVFTDADIIGKVGAKYDEENVFPNILLECNYHHGTGEFHSPLEWHDAEMGERFPQRDKQLKLQSKSINISGAPGWIAVQRSLRSEIQAALRRYQCDEGGRGALHLEQRVHLDHALLDIGDIVTVTVDDVPDMEGSTISGRRARVVGVLPDWKGDAVDVKLQILRGPKLISPAAVIDSVAGNVLTLHNDPPEADALPGSMFGIGNHVIIWDVSGNQSFATTLVDAGAGSVELAALPGAFTIQDDVDFITMGVASTNDTAPTQNGFTPASDFIFQVDDDETDYEADLTGNGESRWR